MSIPDAAVEAAAEALVLNPTAQHPDASRNLTAARAALEAAMPAIQAHILSEAADALDDCPYTSKPFIAGWLRDRAAEASA
jgi:hypothetical protein